MFVKFLLKKFLQSYSARTGFIPMYDTFVSLRVANNLFDRVFLSPIPLHRLAEWFIFEPARTDHLGLKEQNFGNPIFRFGCFSLKAVYNSCKLQELLQVTRVFLFAPLFTLIQSFFPGTYLLKFLSS